MTTMHVEHVRLRATVQDLGRPGWAHLGIPTAGAVDRASLQRANALVGNEGDAAAVEVVLGGLALRCSAATRVAVVGAVWSVDGIEMPVGSACDVSADASIVVGSSIGTYAYVSLAGGIDAPVTLGSRSTDTLSELGPAPLRAG